jgi:hypothetical protein
MNNLTLRCHLGKRWLWLWAGHDMKEPANGNEKQGCTRARWQRETIKRDVESKSWPWQVKTILKDKGSKDIPLFCVAKGVKSTPKLKLWAIQSKKWMAIMTKSRVHASKFYSLFWNFLKKYTRPWGAISASQWFCAQKFVQISTSQQFCGWKILQLLSMKNPTKILYLMISPPENINNGKLISTTYTDLKLRQ